MNFLMICRQLLKLNFHGVNEGPVEQFFDVEVIEGELLLINKVKFINFRA
jgi:hypothetical protein